jgi:hypothetical protein
MNNINGKRVIEKVVRQNQSAKPNVADGIFLKSSSQLKAWYRVYIKALERKAQMQMVQKNISFIRNQVVHISQSNELRTPRPLTVPHAPMSLLSPNISDHFNSTTLNASTSVNETTSQETQTTFLHISPSLPIQAKQHAQVMSYVRTAAVNNTIVGTHSNAVRGVNIENFIPPLRNGITTALGKRKRASRCCQICKLHGNLFGRTMEEISKCNGTISNHVFLHFPN